MTNQDRLNAIAELAAIRKHNGAFSPTQVNRIKVVKQSINDAIADLRAQENSLVKQLRILQGACPHPFRLVSWTEIIPAGGIRGTCDLCSGERWFSDYPKHLTNKAKFKERVGTDGRIVELTI